MANFESQEVNGVNLITCPSAIDGKDMTKIEAAVKAWLVQVTDLHVMDFKNVGLFTQVAYRPFIVFNQQLRRNNKTLFCINLSDKLLSQFRTDGLTTVFIPIGSVEEAKKRVERAGEKTSFDVDVINPFIAAAKTVLETQANLKITIGKPYLKKADTVLPAEIAGYLQLVCKEFKGAIALCFTAEIFLKVYDNMVGETSIEINSENQDAVGELLNIIYGQAKTILNDRKGFTLEKALPTVLTGEKLKFHHQAKAKAIVLPFESTVGNFYMEIIIDHA